MVAVSLKKKKEKKKRKKERKKKKKRRKDNVKEGKNVKLYKCIIDKYVSIPHDEEIGLDLDKDRKRFTETKNNIVVVPQGYLFNES